MITELHYRIGSPNSITEFDRKLRHKIPTVDDQHYGCSNVFYFDYIFLWNWKKRLVDSDDFFFISDSSRWTIPGGLLPHGQHFGIWKKTRAYFWGSPWATHIEISLFCKIIIFEGVGGDAYALGPLINWFGLINGSRVWFFSDQTQDNSIETTNPWQ